MKLKKLYLFLPVSAVFLLPWTLRAQTSKTQIFNAPETEIKLIVEKTASSFSDLIDPQARLVRLYDKAIWTEGPVQLKDGSILFSDIPNNRLLHYQKGKGVQVWLHPAQFQNGHARDSKGRLLAASHGKRAIERLEKNGKWQILVDLYQDRKFNSPNDLAVDQAGEIWFTDPSFGIDFAREGYGGNKVMGGEYVYRYHPKKHRLVRLKTDLVQTPNGIAFSPDGSILYLSECARGHRPEDKNLPSRLVAYDILPDKSLGKGRILAEIPEGNADGMKVDAQGNIWLAAGKKVLIFTPEGQKLGSVTLPETVGNLLLAQAEKGRNRLYITASKSLYALPVKIGPSSFQKRLNQKPLK